MSVVIIGGNDCMHIKKVRAVYKTILFLFM